MLSTQFFHTPCSASGEFYGDTNEYGYFGISDKTSNCFPLFLAHTPRINEDAILMQHLRFPTPPITPPKLSNALNESFLQQQQPQQQPLRTQSVIMQVGRTNILPAIQQQTVNMQTTVVDKKEKHRPESEEENEQLHETSSGKEISCSELRLALSDRESCSYSNSSTSSLEVNYLCQWLNCGRLFESLESLATHISQIHAVATITDGLYHCRWRGCLRMNRGFNARYKMLVHVRTHTKEKPHQCHLCKKCFSRAENLKIHIRSHSGEKPYVCTYKGCQKAYSNSSDRFKHSRTHAIEKPYVCKVPGCQKRYTDPSSLRKHVKTFKHNTQIVKTDAQFDSNKEQLNTIPAVAQQTPPSQYFLHYREKDICQPRHHIIYSAHNASYLYAPNSNVDIMELDMPLDLRLKRT